MPAKVRFKTISNLKFYSTNITPLRG